MKFSHLFCLCFALTFFTSNAQAPPPQGVFGRNYEVSIINSLNVETDLLVAHCRSQEDDLGFVNVTPQAPYLLKFSLPWASRLLFCNLWHGNLQEYHTGFNVIQADQGFLNNECGRPGTSCAWIAKDEGVFLLNKETKAQVLKYKWDFVGSNASKMT